MDKEFEVTIRITTDYIGDLTNEELTNILNKELEEVEITGGIFTGTLSGDVIEVKWTNEPSKCTHCGLVGGH